MFPSVTGKMFPKSICDTDTSAPYNIPCGIKNIFAIECSNPMVTNAVIGQKMAKIFPATLVEAIVPHTAKHTNQLHSTPLTNATVTGNVVAFIVAIAIAGGNVGASTGIGGTGAVADTTGVHRTHTGVDIVAHAVHVGIGLTRTAANA